MTESVVFPNLDRRDFLAQLLALGVLPLGCGGGERSSKRGSGLFLLSAHGDTPEAYGLVIAGLEGSPVRVDAGFRGHDVARHPTRRDDVVLFGRRPGREAIVVDFETARVARRLPAVPGRSFQGHGCFTRDGRTLFTSEAELETAKGWIGVWDATTYRRIDELDTGGLGPHEIQLLPDERTLVVANGGLLTRPETGRKVLNLDSMDSTLAYVDVTSARVDELHRVPEPKASIRHFDVADDGTVAFGVQVQREATGHERIVPLGGVHRRGDDVRLLDARLDVVRVMNDYVGSVAVCNGPRIAGFTSPRGNLAVFWDVDRGDFVGYHELVDVSGLAESTDREHFVLSSSTGEVRTVRASDAVEIRDARRRFEEIRWDNHLLAIEV